MTDEQESRIVSNSLAETGRQTEVVVITVWYNRAEHVRRSISSLLDQTADDYTVFAVDDGSTDDTGRLLEAMLTEAQSHNVPMHVWRKSNEGFVSSIKQAIEQKTDNKIIVLHGAGDISKPDRLQTQLDLLGSNNSVIATGVGVKKINSEGDLVGKKIPPERPNSDPFTGTVPRLGTHGASMYYRDSYEKSGGYREHFVYAQDTDLLLRLRDRGAFLNTDDILYSKLVSDKTVSSNSNWKQNLEQIIYSAAALEAARCRKRGESDPITNIDPGDWDKIKAIAKQNGIHDRAARRSGMLAERCVRNRDLFAVLTIVHFLGVDGLSSVLSYLPAYFKSRFMAEN